MIVPLFLASYPVRRISNRINSGDLLQDQNIESQLEPNQILPIKRTGALPEVWRGVPISFPAIAFILDLSDCSRSGNSIGWKPSVIASLAG
ncbi:hypothetical protein GPECTOR_48g432 [Gonium pectorale]|uniref:Uncharacterized protein n=1 Tax=Gonium pectorale TaxID=33097 RepID=A0A150G9H5_GONPE|nr:hypothetical protein GPECTOR_48g432 [Gonium pectorale]|eukprot:KXZ46000.1 hypothetical protein GPECTOR_48g432 [Gonium pectorale]